MSQSRRARPPRHITASTVQERSKTLVLSAAQRPQTALSLGYRVNSRPITSRSHNIFVCTPISWCHRRQRVYNANRENRNDAVELTCADFTKISPPTSAVRQQSNLPSSDRFLLCFLSAFYIYACASPLSVVCTMQWKKGHVVHPLKQRYARTRVVPCPTHKTTILGRALFRRSLIMRRP